MSYWIRKTVVSRWSKKLVKVIWFGWYWVKGDSMNGIVDLKWHWCELVNITMTSRSVYIPGPPPWGFRISGNPTKIIRVSTKLFSDSLILSVIWILLQNIHHNKFQLGWLDSKCYVIILILDLPLGGEVYCYVTLKINIKCIIILYVVFVLISYSEIRPRMTNPL